MELRGTPVSVRGNFAGRAHRDCEVARRPSLLASPDWLCRAPRVIFPTDVNASWRSQSPYLRVACANSPLCGLVSLGRGTSFVSRQEAFLQGR